MTTQIQATLLKDFSASLLVSVCLLVPFIVLEWVNSSAFQQGFPFVLFTFMAFHALFIGLSITPALKRFKTQRNLGALKLGHWAGLLLGAFLLCLYANVVIDQLPCFLGVPNCD